MASQRFCLRWNNHQSNLLTVFDQLLHAETFTDVTLAIDGQYLKAHKMVLSACSPYFQQLFINHPEKHPIVILRDIPYADMKSLLDFMYRGEVSVDQERLSAFLRVAESLRIKGLTEVNDEKPANGNSSSNNNSSRDQTDTPLSSSSQQNRMQSYVQQQQRKVLQQQQVSQQGLTSSSPIGSSMPKRKRGRPRKLSGSDDVDDYDDDYRENLLQGSPDDLLDVKMTTDNETNSDEAESRRRTVDTDEQDSRSNQKRLNDDGTHNSNNSKKDDSANDGLLIPKEEPMEITQEAPLIRINDFVSLAQPETTLITPPTIRTRHVKISNNNQNDHNNDSTANDINSDNNSDAWIKQDDESGNNSFMKSPIIITSNNSSMSSPTSGGKSVRRRIRRKNNSPDDQAEALTEMSVRGLNLFRYAAVQDGVYQCTECLKENVTKTFKNKYSFQRHAFLYHEGTQRKVFPCPVCRKEFSRPDKMKNHMKMTHECYMPKECKFPIPLLMQAGSSQSAQITQPMNNNVVATSQ